LESDSETGSEAPEARPDSSFDALAGIDEGGAVGQDGLPDSVYDAQDVGDANENETRMDAKPAPIGQAGQVACVSTSCQLSARSDCCLDTLSGDATCGTQGLCPAASVHQSLLHCDSAASCRPEGAGLLCCYSKTPVEEGRSVCGGTCGPATVSATSVSVQLCDPTTNECKSGTCKPATALGGLVPVGYYACL